MKWTYIKRFPQALKLGWLIWRLGHGREAALGFFKLGLAWS